MSTDFGGFAMTAHPRHPVFILPEKVSASSDTTDVSPDTAVRHHDTKNNARNSILSLLLSAIMLVKPSLVSAQASQPQGPVKEPQKVEAPQKVEQSVLIQKTLEELFMAIAKNDAEKVKEILSRGIIGINTRYQGMTLLHVAVYTESSAIIEFFIEQGADINAADNKGVTPLQYAVAAGDKDIVLLLLKHGVSVDTKNNNGRTLLHYAAGASVRGMESNGNPDVVQLLLDKGLDANVKDDQGVTPLHYTAATGNKNIVLLLLKHGADVNAVDEYGLTPLHHAVAEGQKEIIVMLFEYGASVNLEDNAGRTALHYAAGAYLDTSNRYEEWQEDVIQLLLDKGADIDAKDFFGRTPLFFALVKPYINAIKLLIERGADVNCVDRRGYTPYSWVNKQISCCELVSAPGFKKAVVELKKVAEILRESLEYGYCVFVAPDGQDTNPGTLKCPLKTLSTALDIVAPGDSVIVRGGIYRCPRTIYINKSGEVGKPIRLAGYPGETPILDFSGTRGYAFLVTGAHWHFKNLSITGAELGIRLDGDKSHHCILEQLAVYKNYGYETLTITEGSAYNIVLNCDVYDNCDLDFKGGAADGIQVFRSSGQGNILIGNRSWNNSDDGYDCFFASHAVCLERCYAWRNGQNIWGRPFFRGDANGFKGGGGEGRHVLIGCLAWGHSLTGATLNGNTSGVILRNCTFWDNDTNYFFEWSGWQEEARKNCVFSNNISYNGHKKDSINPKAQSQHNSWDASLGPTLTDEDFVSLDDSAMTQPRNPDGSIPQNDFLKLAPTSAAIDKGTDVNMPFVGKKPDLGAFEYDPNASRQGYVKMLHQYVRDRDIKKIKALLTQGEGINDKDWLGYTPLQWAAYFGYPDVVELLLSQGANPDIQSDTGRFALEIAKAMVYADIEALLRKHGAKQRD